MAGRLNPQILDYLVKKLGLSKEGIQSRISETRRDRPSLTLNAAAALFAKSKGISIMGRLDDEDRQSIIGTSPIAITSTSQKVKSGSRKPKFIVFILYPSKDRFQKRHVDEVNRAYNSGCYTASFILSRKIIENLVIDILLKRFPEKNKQNRELYYDTGKHRFKDFSIILDNIFLKRNSFPPSAIVPIQQLYNKAKYFSKDANDKVHSWFHIASKTELDQANIQEIIDLIIKIEQTLV